MVIRRHADPISVQHIWNAVRHLSIQKQPTDGTRILKYIQKIYNYSQTQAELYLKQTTKDGLIIHTSKSSKTSSPSAESNESYTIPTKDEPVLDGRDWYCFECHLAGDVTPCKICFRVFHPDCITNGQKKFDLYKKNVCVSSNNDLSFDKSDVGAISLIVDEDSSVNTSRGAGTTSRAKKRSLTAGQDVYDNNHCLICNISKIDVDSMLSKTEINYLLKFVLHRIRAWLPIIITHTMAAEDTPEWLSESELTWRANQLFFEHSDMSVMEVNLNSDSYESYSEFFADVLTVQHNVAIFHGIESQEYGASDLMIRDCLHDLGELRNCSDCYRHSNEKVNAKWFCLPCRDPHNLVWAKQKGYPYWPAKVIRETSTHFDVRFFGGKYERSLLVKSSVKPISVSKQALQIKSSSAFNKAYEELRYHQKLLSDPVELQKLLASSKVKRRSPSKQKSSTLLNHRSSSGSNRNSSSSSLNTSSQLNSTTGSRRSSGRRSGTKRKQNSESASSNKRSSQELVNQMPSTSDNTISDNVIDISDGEDDDDDEEYSYRQAFPVNNMESEGVYEQVSSSTENYRNIDGGASDGGMQSLDHPYSDSVEKMRRKLLGLSEKKEIIKCAMDCMQTEIDKITNDHNDYLKRLFESHNAQISETKKKQWCYNCEQDAIYHCCWNTAYCSQTCQQQHWQAEHKKVCRRKR